MTYLLRVNETRKAQSTILNCDCLAISAFGGKRWAGLAASLNKTWTVEVYTI